MQKLIALGIALAVGLVAGTAGAVVRQVGGAIVPVDIDGDRTPPCANGNLQECLDAEEATTPPNPPAIDAVADAFVGSGAFWPDTSSASKTSSAISTTISRTCS